MPAFLEPLKTHPQLLNVLLEGLVAALCGVVPALLELWKNYPNCLDIVFCSVWSWYILSFNAGCTICLYVFVRYGLGFPRGIWGALLIGLIFSLAIRGRFTLYRHRQQPQPFLKLDELYQTIQESFYEKLEIVLAAERRKQTNALIEWLTVDRIEQEVRNKIACWPTETTQDELERKLAKILQECEENPRDKAIYLAVFLIKIYSRSEVKILINNFQKLQQKIMSSNYQHSN